MTYLDYCATTKVDEKVLKRLEYICNSYFANPNSNHKLGLESNKVIVDATNNILNKLNISTKEIIYTSGASESNNLVIKGLMNKGKHIITTKFEHSSILSPCGYLQTLGYKIDFVNTDKDGVVDINHLKSLINDDTFLVSIGAVNSEIGIRQPIEEIGILLKSYSNIYFHSDITQIIGKNYIDLTNVDLASFSGHKIYTFKGIGALIKNKDIKLIPLIHGGKSTSIYRSGTPQLELIDSLSYALNLVYEDFNNKKEYVSKLSIYLKDNLSKYSNIIINSSDKCIPNIINFSILNKNADHSLNYFSLNDIYLSTKTACSSNNDYSLGVYELTKDINRASSSLRVSISHKTTKEDIDKFLEVLSNY